MQKEIKESLPGRHGFRLYRDPGSLLQEYLYNIANLEGNRALADRYNGGQSEFLLQKSDKVPLGNRPIRQQNGALLGPRIRVDFAANAIVFPHNLEGSAGKASGIARGKYWTRSFLKQLHDEI